MTDHRKPYIETSDAVVRGHCRFTPHDDASSGGTRRTPPPTAPRRCPIPPPVRDTTAPRIFWRPWMARLGVVLLVALPFLGLVPLLACTLPAEYQSVPIVAGVLDAVATLALGALCARDNELTPWMAVGLAWWPLALPFLGLRLLVKWVALGKDA